MCGIFGTIGINSVFAEDFLHSKLGHRGPDDRGLFSDRESHFQLGHTRLSIIDLSHQAHQPMSDESGRFTIVFNGEIYNYRELKEALEKKGCCFQTGSDTEVVLTAFSKTGVSSFEDLRGMFALAIYDRELQTVTLARDRWGVKPLIYSSSSGGFVFSSELKALLASGLVESEVDGESLDELLAFGAVRQPRTLLQSVFHLPPGHFMQVQKDCSYEIRRYCNPLETIDKPLDLSYDEAVGELRKRLEEATRYHLVADVEVGCFLSGGVDSTAVLALMSRLTSRPIKAFSVGFDHQGEVCDESLVAERSAKALGAEFQRLTVSGGQVADIFGDFVRSLDQPSIDGLNTYLVSRETSRHVKVALSGLGGDEIFAGYPHFAWIPQGYRQAKPFWEGPLRHLHRVRPSRFTRKAHFKGMEPEAALEEVRTIFNATERREIMLEERDLPHREHGLPVRSPLLRLSVAEIDGYLRDTLLRDVDAISMWHSLEVRPVLLDHPLVEFALRLPDDFKVRDNRLKAIFVDAVKDLIPAEVWQRRKTGFDMPLAHWMNGVLRSQIAPLWDSPAAGSIFKESYLRQMKLNTEKGRLSKRDWLPTILVAWCVEYGIGGSA